MRPGCVVLLALPSASQQAWEPPGGLPPGCRAWGPQAQAGRGHDSRGLGGPPAHPAVGLCVSSGLLPRGPPPRHSWLPRLTQAVSLPPGAAALPPEPAHSPLGRRRRQPAAGRGLPPQVCLRGRPQSLQEMSPGPPPWPPPPRAAHPTAGRLKATAEERPCWSGWPGRGPGPGEGWRPLFSEIPKRAREGPGHAGPERGRASPSATLEHPCQTPTSWSPRPGWPERQTLSERPAVRVPGAEGGGSHLLTYLEM